MERPSNIPWLARTLGTAIANLSVVGALYVVAAMADRDADYQPEDYLMAVATVGVIPLALGLIAAVLGYLAEREEARPPEGTGQP